MKREAMHKSRETAVWEHFDKHAKDWHTIYLAKDLPSLIIQERRAYVLRYLDTLELKKGAKILDLGCGSGLTSVKLLQRGFIVTCIDISESMLDLARENCAQFGLESNVIFQVGNAAKLDLEDNSFDAVVSMGIIEYLQRDREALEEIHRVLKPGGYLIITVPNRLRLDYITNPFYLMKNLEQSVLNILKRGDTAKFAQTLHNNVRRNLYTLFSLKRMLTELDFNVIDSISHGFGPFILLRQSDRLSKQINQILKRYNESNCLPFLSEMGSQGIILCQKRDLPKK